MFSTSNFNNVIEERLHRKFPHKIDLKYGLDAGKFSGVKKFPLGNFESHFKSNSTPNVSSLIFHSKYLKDDKRFDIPISKKYAPPEAEPYRFNEPVKNPMPQRKNIGSFVSKLYGMPKDKDVIIESTAGQTMNLEMGGLTETKFMIHNWRKEFGGDGRFMDLISGSNPTADDTAADDSNADDSKADDSKADDSKEETKADHKEVQKIKIKVKKTVTATPAFQSEPVAEPKTPEPRSQSQQKTPNPMEHRTLLVKSREPSEKISGDDDDEFSTPDSRDELEKLSVLLPEELAEPILDKISIYGDKETVPQDVIDHIRTEMALKGLKLLPKNLKQAGAIKTAVYNAFERNIMDGIYNSSSKDEKKRLIENLKSPNKKLQRQFMSRLDSARTDEAKTPKKKSGDTISTKDIKLDV